MIVWPLSCCPVPAASAAPSLTAARGPGTVPPAGVSGQRRQTAGIEPRAALQIGPLAARTNASAAGKNTLCDPPGRNTARTAPMRASGKRIVPCPGNGTRNTKTHTIQPEMQSAAKSRGSAKLPPAFAAYCVTYRPILSSSSRTVLAVKSSAIQRSGLSMIPAAASASTAASSSGSVSWDPWPPQRARNASQAPAKHFFFSHISCPNFSKNLSRHTDGPLQRLRSPLYKCPEQC